jgi:hypothetical protein
MIDCEVLNILTWPNIQAAIAPLYAVGCAAAKAQ